MNEYALCRTEHVWHPVEMVRKAVEREAKSPGMNLGRLEPEERERRAAKNARWSKREHPHGTVHDLDMPVPGSSKRVRSRLFTKGNRQRRGVQP